MKQINAQIKKALELFRKELFNLSRRLINVAFHFSILLAVLKNIIVLIQHRLVVFKSW